MYFFSLDAANPLAVQIARRWFHLPYFNASMKIKNDGETIFYSSVRTHKNSADATFIGNYGAVGNAIDCKADSLENWLTARYYLFTGYHGKSIISGGIHHNPWPLQRAFWEPETQTAVQAAGINIPNSQPHLLFAKQLDVMIWRPEHLK